VAGAGVWEHNLRTSQSIWSPEVYELFGIDPATSPAETHIAWQHRIHPEDRQKDQAWVEQARHETGVRSLDYRILGPEGEVRWIRSRAIMVAGSDGEPERMVGIEVDVTQEYRRTDSLRSRAEALEGEVEEQRRELDRFFSLSSDLFAVGGFDGRLSSVNPAWTRILGYSERELLARPVMGIIHPDDHRATAEAFVRLRAGSTIQQFRARLRCEDGRIVWIDWAGVAAGDRFYAVGRDVTREREREEILRQSQKMEALGQLTGGIAHDFNNLLQAVQGSFALILKRPESVDRVRSLAEQGLQATRRGSSLSAQLLAFSRSQQLEVQPVSLGRALADMHDLLRRSLDPMVRIVLQPLEADLVALVDPTQLEMAVLNLSLNARDAMPAGGTIAIQAEARRIGADPELPPGDYVVLHVKDTGTGMPPDVAQRAFEPFFTTKGRGKGTGLGLSQVYAMARQSGGTVRLDTQPNQGTTVCLFLRRAETPASERNDIPAGRAGEDAVRPAATILVVDDDDDVRRSLVSALETMGYGVIEAADGSSGLAGLDREPDVMVVDFAMPGMNGAEVVQAARTIRPDLPIILATGYADTSAIESLADPTLVVLRKPFELDELDAALRGKLAHEAGPAGRVRARPASDETVVPMRPDPLGP
jgi:PAS domain S-box-containing protein